MSLSCIDGPALPCNETGCPAPIINCSFLAANNACEPAVLTPYYMQGLAPGLRTSLLHALRTGGAGQLDPGAHCTYGYQPRARCGTVHRCTPGELPIEKIWEKSAPIAHPMPVWMYCGLSCKQCGSDTLTEADLDRIARHDGPAASERVWGVAGNPLHSNPHPHSHPHPHPDPSQAPTPNGSTTYQATSSTPAHGTRPSTRR